MNNGSLNFITCGMYAFTDELRAAWQSLFDGFIQIYTTDRAIEPTIYFETDFALLRDPQMLIGHTCGYPLMRFLQDDAVPICVPLFDVSGCNGKFYSSQIIVPVNSDIQALADCRGKIAAINGRDSNSGMNVLRHAISGLSNGKSFFTEVIESGSHYQSLLAVAENQAQVATIDCVSFALIKDQWPDLIDQVRVIGYTEATCGLPFVVPINGLESINIDKMIDALNIALSRLTDANRNRLHLLGFEPVKLSDYDSIMTLENTATSAGYPVII